MTDLMTLDEPVRPDQVDPTGSNREGTLMLLHEALARSRQREAEEAARRFALARSLTAGRRWERLARFAVRRAVRARVLAGAAPLDRGSRSAAGGTRSAV